MFEHMLYKQQTKDMKHITVKERRDRIDDSKRWFLAQRSIDL